MAIFPSVLKFDCKNLIYILSKGYLLYKASLNSRTFLPVKFKAQTTEPTFFMVEMVRGWEVVTGIWLLQTDFLHATHHHFHS